MRKLIRSIVRGVLLEVEGRIDTSNIMSMYNKIMDVIEHEENLKQGMLFLNDNWFEYGKDKFVTDTIDSVISSINTFLKEKRPRFFDEKNHQGDHGYKWTGSNYHQTKDLSSKELSKFIREELSIRYPDWKFSVRTDARGGRSIDVEILDLPYDPFSDEYSHALKTDTDADWNRRTDFRVPMYNQQYIKDSKDIERIVDRYNMDDSDIQSDYHHVRYYGNVKLNERNVKRKWYPENKEFQRWEKWHADYDAKTKADNAAAAARKGKFKKGTQVIFSYAGDKKNPPGDYPAVILKSPNGRGLFTDYTIRFTVDKRYDPNGNIIDVPPVTYGYSTREDKLRLP